MRCELSAAYLKKEELDEAISGCKKVLEINPGYAPAHNNLGLAYERKGLFEEAFRSSERLSPSTATTLWLIEIWDWST